MNPDVEAGGHPHISTGHHTHKFGIDWEHALPLYLQYRDSRWIEWQGISAHIGSQILTLAPYRRALARLARYFRQLTDAGIPLRYLDIRRRPRRALLGREAASPRPITPRRSPAFSGRSAAICLLEPGRSIIAPAGVLLMRVLYTKRNRGKTFVVVDAAMNDFIRPALYDAVHPITAGAAPEWRSAGENPRRYRRTGLRIRRLLLCRIGPWPRPAREIYSCLWGAGAYGFVETSNYNSRPRPAGDSGGGRRFRVIRRRETRTDLVRGE